MIRLAAFRFNNRTFLAMADNKPPERERDPVIRIDMSRPKFNFDFNLIEMIKEQM